MGFSAPNCVFLVDSFWTNGRFSNNFPTSKNLGWAFALLPLLRWHHSF